jgi:hypothetical protein
VIRKLEIAGKESRIRVKIFIFLDENALKTV